jgi:hypothetical protein
LHLLISQHEIELDCFAIFDDGIQCTDNKIKDGHYLVFVILPTNDGSIKCDCAYTNSAQFKERQCFEEITGLKLPAQWSDSCLLGLLQSSTALRVTCPNAGVSLTLAIFHY